MEMDNKLRKLSEQFRQLVQCPICLDELNDPVSTSCNHTYCRSCILEHIRLNGTNKCFCPTCKKQINKRGIKKLDNFKGVITGVSKLMTEIENDMLNKKVKEIKETSEESEVKSAPKNQHVNTDVLGKVDDKSRTFERNKKLSISLRGKLKSTSSTSSLSNAIERDRKKSPMEENLNSSDHADLTGSPVRRKLTVNRDSKKILQASPKFRPNEFSTPATKGRPDLDMAKKLTPITFFFDKTRPSVTVSLKNVKMTAANRSKFLDKISEMDNEDAPEENEDPYAFISSQDTFSTEKKKKRKSVKNDVITGTSTAKFSEASKKTKKKSDPFAVRKADDKKRSLLADPIVIDGTNEEQDDFGIFSSPAQVQESPKVSEMSKKRKRLSSKQFVAETKRQRKSDTPLKDVQSFVDEINRAEEYELHVERKSAMRSSKNSEESVFIKPLSEKNVSGTKSLAIVNVPVPQSQSTAKAKDIKNSKITEESRESALDDCGANDEEDRFQQVAPPLHKAPEIPKEPNRICRKCCPTCGGPVDDKGSTTVKAQPTLNSTMTEKSSTVLPSVNTEDGSSLPSTKSSNGLADGQSSHQDDSKSHDDQQSSNADQNKSEDSNSGPNNKFSKDQASCMINGFDMEDSNIQTGDKVFFGCKGNTSDDKTKRSRKTVRGLASLASIDGSMTSLSGDGKSTDRSEGSKSGLQTQSLSDVYSITDNSAVKMENNKKAYRELSMCFSIDDDAVITAESKMNPIDLIETEPFAILSQVENTHVPFDVMSNEEKLAYNIKKDMEIAERNSKIASSADANIKSTGSLQDFGSELNRNKSPKNSGKPSEGLNALNNSKDNGEISFNSSVSEQQSQKIQTMENDIEVLKRTTALLLEKLAVLQPASQTPDGLKSASAMTNTQVPPSSVETLSIVQPTQMSIKEEESPELELPKLYPIPQCQTREYGRILVCAEEQLSNDSESDEEMSVPTLSYVGPVRSCVRSSEEGSSNDSFFSPTPLF